MKDNFLESDFLSAKQIALFGLSHVTSSPSIAQIKRISQYHDQLVDAGCHAVWCVSFDTFELFDFLMPKFSKQIKFLQTNRIDFFRELLHKRGHPEFLKNYWQFAALLQGGQVLHYIEQPLMNKLSADPATDMYSVVRPDLLLNSYK